jgi:hypothetical protein
MDKEALIEYASMGAQAALDAAMLFTRAVTAANSGDQVQADAYLAQARGRWDAAAQGWAAAGEPPAEPAEPTA